MIGIEKRSDFYIWRVRNPRNRHNYILILDKISSSCHLVIGPRMVRVRGFAIDKLITDEDINRFKEMRKSKDIENEVRYEL